MYGLVSIWGGSKLFYSFFYSSYLRIESRLPGVERPSPLGNEVTRSNVVCSNDPSKACEFAERAVRQCMACISIGDVRAPCDPCWGRGDVFFMFSPSLINRSLPGPEASKNHFETGCVLESSSGCVGSKAFFGVPDGAAMAETKSRSLLLSNMGSARGVSAARIASSPLAVLNVPL
jgi:hypothetical protein